MVKNETKPRALPLVGAAVFVALTLTKVSSQVITTTDTFGNGTNSFTIDFVSVDNPGNAADTNGFGSVSYKYRIGKYEIPQTAIDGSTASGLSNVTAGSWTNDQPAAGIGWHEAAAFVNWLNTSTGRQAAYNIVFTNGAWTMALWSAADAWTQGGTNFYRHKNAYYFIPSENEWYKAAYFNPVGTNYFIYPTASNSYPTAVVGGTNEGTAVFSQLSTGKPAAVNNAGGLSAYRTMGQGGNVWEWNESGYRGGSYEDNTAGRSSHRAAVNWLTNLSPFKHKYWGFRIASVTAMPSPRILVEQPVGSVLVSQAASLIYPSILVSNSFSPVSFAVRNAGEVALSNIAISTTGSSAGEFIVTPPATDWLAPDAVAIFSVSFAPKAGGTRNAQLHITSTDSNNSPFVVNLSGFCIGDEVDTDGDTLNDAAEFTMSTLGFNWQSNQPSLVAALYNNANRAELFTRSQYDANYSNGVNVGMNIILSNPGSYNLYTSNSIMDLRMNGLIVQRQGSNAVLSFQPQTTSDLGSQPFTNNGTPMTGTIPMPGNKGFIRIQAH